MMSSSSRELQKVQCIRRRKSFEPMVVVVESKTWHPPTLFLYDLEVKRAFVKNGKRFRPQDDTDQKQKQTLSVKEVVLSFGNL